MKNKKLGEFSAWMASAGLTEKQYLMECGMVELKEDSIAPCGMNCNLCLANQRDKNHCKGCRIESDILYKRKGSSSCIIKNCPTIQSSKTGFCFECDKFPCLRLKQLDKRYRTKYFMSMIENLKHIELYGMDSFLQNERVRWACKKCGNIVCVHRFICFKCKTPYLK